MPATMKLGLYSRLTVLTLVFTALLFYPFQLKAQEKSAPPEGTVSAEGGEVRHLEFEEEGIPELASIMDYIRAGTGKVIVAAKQGTLTPGEKPGSFILTDDSVDFFEQGVGAKAMFPKDRVKENMLYTAWIKPESGDEERLIIKVVERHTMELESAEAAGKEKKEKGKEPKTVTYRVKEEQTLTSNIYGEGIMGLNWQDLTNVVFAFFVILCLGVISFIATHKAKKIPHGFQALVEMLVGGLDNFTKGILGDRNRPYLPLVGTLFLYILFMALLGLVPFAKSPIALNYNVPLSLALIVFFFVQVHAVKMQGVGGYLKHMMGEPIWLAPLQFPLHIMGEFVKPLSLSLRLFANISAEDILVAALVLMMVGLPFYVPVPLQILFFPLALLFSLIQALVFMALSSVYIALTFPQHEEGHH